MGVVVVRQEQKGEQRYYLHEVLIEKRTETPFKTGDRSLPGGESYPSLLSILQKIKNINRNKEKAESIGAGVPAENGSKGSAVSPALNDSIPNPDGNNNRKFSFKDSEGRELSREQAEYFKDSKVRDEDGNLLAVYHGSSEDFTVFDREKTRANMDIQGNFFSPWELDASGYGGNVRAFYLNITNPAPEGVAYKALNKFQGQNGAGIKAREYLESLGYDGVNSEGEEYIAFYPEQVKEVSNASPTSSPDIRYSLKEDADITYDSLVAKQDMKVVDIMNQDLSAYKNIKAREAAKKIRDVLKKRNGIQQDEILSIWNEDQKKGIEIGLDGLKHGLVKYNEANLLVSLHVDDYLKNSIKVNETVPDDAHQWDADLMLGYGQDSKGNRIAAYFVVKNNTRDRGEVVDFGSLYSVNGKKISEDSIHNDRQGLQAPTSDTISISDLLGIVNEMYSDILPKSVAGHYGHGRKESKLGASTRFSLPDTDSVNDYINVHGTEFVEAPPVRDYEIAKQRVKNQTHGELLAQIEKLSRDKRLTHGRVLDKGSVKESMNSMVRTLMAYSESYTPGGGVRRTNHKLVDMATENASAIYRAIKEGDFAGASTAAYETAREIVENLELVNDAAFKQYRAFRDYLRETPVRISEQDAKDIPDYAMWKKKQFGRMRIVKEGGIPVDSVYMELCEVYPELFSEDVTHPADQLMAMAGARESLEPYDIMLSAEETEQLIKQTAQDMLDISATGKPWKSFADKFKESYDRKLKLVKERHKEAMRDVKIRERMRAARMVDREKLKHREYRQKQKDRKEHIRRFGSIQENYEWLSGRLLKPTDDKHIPEGFRTELAHLLQQFDLQTERSKKLEEKYGKAQKTVQMDSLRRKLEDIAKEDGSGAFEYDGYVFELMDAAAERINGRGIDGLSDEDLRAVDILLKSVRHNIQNYNKAFSEHIKQGRTEVAEAIMADADKRIAQRKGKHKKEKGGPAGELIAQNATPRELHERMGKAASDLFMGIRKGFDSHIDNMAEMRETLGGIFKKYNNKKKPGSKIEKWRGKRDAVTVKLDSGASITMSRAQVMSLYCAGKREQYAAHITMGGIKLTSINAARKIEEAFTGGTKGRVDSSRYVLTANDMQKLVSELTEEQVSMADELHGILNGTCKEWGNETSMKIYGYKKFTEDNYFPIKVSSDFTYKKPGEQGGAQDAMNSILNAGFTKSTVANAANPVVIDDIFTVVAEHINQMSLYNALAPAIADYNRVFNYQRHNGDGSVESVREKISQAWGSRYSDYMKRFISDIDGNFQMQGKDALEKIAAKSLANYKVAAIAFNARVAVQQPTAIVRAMALINPVYFGAMDHAPALLKKAAGDESAYQDMVKHCPVARWKSWGFTQVDMAKSVEDIMMNNEWSREEFLTMRAYGALDNWAWSKIWKAVRAETKAKHKDVKVDSDEFYRICNERASEIFDKTQVVDSPLHRSQLMRDTGVFHKMMTAFMAEPTKTWNMLVSSYADAAELARDGNYGKAAGRAMWVTGVFVMNAVAVSAASAVIDMLRGKDADDDGEEDGWLKNFLENLKGNMNPLNMLPLLKDITSYLDGWGSQNMALDGLADALKAAKAVYDKMGGGSDKGWDELIRDLAEASGYLFGKPIKNVLREFETWTKVFGINAFAAEAGDDGTLSKVKGTLMDKWAALFGRESSSGDGEAGRDKSDSDYYGIYADSEESLWDKITDKTYAERQKADREKRVSDIEKDAGGLSGDERDEAIWKAATKNYTRYVEDGEMDVLQEMRRTLDELEGDVEKFDESVLAKVKKAYKKNIGGDLGMLVTYDEYLLGQGFTEEKISSEVIAKSGTAKEFQKQVCMGDYDAAVDALADLISAGITENDIYALYYNRAKSIDASDYSSGVFIAPVSGRVSSGYGYRDAPTAGASSFHQAIDIAAPAGSDVVAADGGKVTRADWGNGYGWTVEILHGNGRYTKYSHLQGYTVQKGDVVSQGQLIGYVGSTGNSTGPHLDFKVKEGGQWVDPMNYLQ